MSKHLIVRFLVFPFLLENVRIHISDQQQSPCAIIVSAFITPSTQTAVPMKAMHNYPILDLFGPSRKQQRHQNMSVRKIPHPISTRTKSIETTLSMSNDNEKNWVDNLSEEEIKDYDEQILKQWKQRRSEIRKTLRQSESLRNFRIEKGFVPDEGDENADSKRAIGITAFVFAVGAVLLRVGGRAALASAIGLDFANDNPEIKNQLEAFLAYASDLGPILEPALFVAAWTLVKVLCFDAGGIVLALSSGLLFGGVLQGAVFSAAAATFGSSVAFGLAKIDSPFRKKALELLDEFPSLRGIEKTVAKDGVKAVLTLRLAPLIPIPLGAYNYVYGVTNVKYLDFVCGIFLGSLKPYFFDSYLGYFGKALMDGEGDGTQDFVLLSILAVSVLIGVFASELAAETWQSVQEELDAEKLENMEEDGEIDDGIMKEVLGMELPLWVVGAQQSLQKADITLRKAVNAEYEARVWNYTEPDSIPDKLDPSKFKDSAEVIQAKDKLDVRLSDYFSEGFVLSSILFTAFWDFADPLWQDSGKPLMEVTERAHVDTITDSFETTIDIRSTNVRDAAELTDQELLESLNLLLTKTENRMEELDDEMQNL
mmetsp:Transcript_56177/g.65619  ORF Transcript_56177/g.65619 Transcript_56177/m.65619 type:complete len:597 (-) Transcript_56177:36-1826(-)